MYLRNVQEETRTETSFGTTLHCIAGELPAMEVRTHYSEHLENVT